MLDGDFYSRIDEQKSANLKRFGRQDIPTLLIACAEELGEVCHAYLNLGSGSPFELELVHLGALLPVIYDQSISEKGVLPNG